MSVRHAERHSLCPEAGVRGVPAMYRAHVPSRDQVSMKNVEIWAWNRTKTFLNVDHIDRDQLTETRKRRKHSTLTQRISARAVTYGIWT